MKQNSARGVGVLFAGHASPVTTRLQGMATTVKGIGWVSSVSGMDALEDSLCKARPDVLVLTVRPPSGDIHRQVYALRQRLELPPLVLLCACPPEQLTLLSVSVGAACCISERLSPRSILNTIVDLAHGNCTGRHNPANNHGLCGPVVDALRHLPPPDNQAPDPLSRRQHEVLMLVAQGCSNKEIGATLFIQEQTVKNHVSAILHKMDAKDRASAAAKALQRGWVPIG